MHDVADQPVVLPDASGSPPVASAVVGAAPASDAIEPLVVMPVARRKYGTNSERLRVKSGITSFQLGRWPPGSGGIVKRANEFKQSLLQAVADRNSGSVNLYHASLVNSAVKHEIAARLLQRWLNKELEADREDDPKLAQQIAAGRANAVKQGFEVKIPEPPKVRRKPLGLLERASLMKDITAHTDAIGNCLKKLNLDQAEVANLWGQIHDRPEEDEGDAGEGDG